MTKFSKNFNVRYSYICIGFWECIYLGMYCSDCIMIDKMKDGHTIQITVLLVQHLTFKAGGDIHESFV